MKIEHFIESRLRNAELISIADSLSVICGAYDWSKTPVEALYTNINKSNDALKNHVNLVTTAVETKKVNKLDLLFNHSWRAAKLICQACKLSPNPEEQKAAFRLLSLAKMHGINLHKKSYQEKSSRAELFLLACETREDIKEAIEQINFHVYVDRIKLNLENLKAGISERDRKRVNESRDGSVKETRRKLYNDMLNLFKYMEVMSDTVKDGKFDAMILRINETIKKIEASIALRHSHAHRKESGE